LPGQLWEFDRSRCEQGRPTSQTLAHLKRKVTVVTAGRYGGFQSQLEAENIDKMNLVMVSDTHGARPSLPAGDVLVHCGDLTYLGSFAELRSEVEWLKSLPFRHIVLIAGNHDVALGNLYHKGLEPQTRKLLFGSIHYLRDSGLVIDGVKVWGSPWIPPYAGSFNPQENELQQKWDLIPSDTDVLVTHGPPAGVLDGGTGCPRLAATCASHPARDSLLRTCSRISRSNFRRHQVFQLRGYAFHFSCSTGAPLYPLMGSCSESQISMLPRAST
jgi:predicted phosphodiesterase